MEPQHFSSSRVDVCSDPARASKLRLSQTNTLDVLAGMHATKHNIYISGWCTAVYG